MPGLAQVKQGRIKKTWPLLTLCCLSVVCNMLVDVCVCES